MKKGTRSVPCLVGVAWIAACLAGPAALAQEPEGGLPSVSPLGAAGLAGEQLPDVEVFDVVAGFGGEVVTGAPYSAESETEFVQTLADGNRIVRRTTAAVHRDGQGRTRRELGPPLLGPLAAPAEEERRVVIDDPVADVSWLLDPQRRTARRQPRVRVSWTADADADATAALPPPGGPLPPAGPGDAMWTRETGSADAVVVEGVHVAVTADAEAPRFGVFTRGPGGADEEDAREEPLGVRDFSGTAAAGVRRVVTIPAGRVGNEKPIEIVSERWYSEELHAVVESVRRDPRVGETRFRLKNLRLGEPDPALFEVPAGWSVEERSGPDTLIFHERRERP